MTDGLRLSVVIAARDASATLAACLEAACSQAGEGVEIIVVDDYSSDSTASIAGDFPVNLIRFDSHRGVAAARNAGAEAARGKILLFLDADVIASRGLFENGLRTLAETGADAVIGSYDDNPAARSMVSRFKNLAHHHFHQRSAGATATFWGACGFIKRDLFHQAGGFDEKRYIAPSIEDVELGVRLARGGAAIRLEPHLQVTHLKRWTLLSMLHADVVRRAVPWAILARESGSLPSNLNFSAAQRVAAAVALGEVIAAAAFVGGLKSGLVLAVGLLMLAAALNLGLLRLFYRKGGLPLLAAGFLLQQFYYLYSLFGLGLGTAAWLLGRQRPAEKTSLVYWSVFAVVAAIQLIVIYRRRQMHPGDFDVAREFGRRFLAGEDIYRGGLQYPYMPIAAMFFAPLAMAPAGVAFALRYFIAVGCLFLIMGLLFRMVCSRRAEMAGWGMAMGTISGALAAHYIIRDLDDAGLHTILLAMIVGGMFLVWRGRETLGAVCISFPIAVKVTPALFIAFMLWKKKWRLALTCLAATIVWIAMPMVVMGPSRWAHFQWQWTTVAVGQMLGGPQAVASGTEHAERNQSLRAAVVSYFGSTVNALQERHAEHAATLMGLLLVLACAWRSRRQYRSADDPDWIVECSGVLVLILLLSPVTWAQHMVFLIPAIYLIVADPLASRFSRAIVQVAMAVYVLFSMLLTREIVGRERYMTLLTWHTQTLCMLIVLGVILFRARALETWMSGAEAHSGGRSEAESP